MTYIDLLNGKILNTELLVPEGNQYLDLTGIEPTNMTCYFSRENRQWISFGRTDSISQMYATETIESESREYTILRFPIPDEIFEQIIVSKTLSKF